ncbi:MAG: nucleoside monophosphate kinase [Chloroflexi bacterium]|nr:nucleoside monophosphate kinase [Chloroflexota bacterium]
MSHVQPHSDSSGAGATWRTGNRRAQLVLLFGGPGAGKGTQASRLSRALGWPHISSGDLLRDHQRSDTQNVMSSGELLPDDEVTRLVLQRLEQPDAANGAILDGFPRTVAQARALDAWLTQHSGAIRAAFYLHLAPDALVARILSRRQMSHRGDDNAASAERRMQIFNGEMPPILDHYAALGKLPCSMSAARWLASTVRS